jgi:hypothetical protein
VIFVAEKKMCPGAWMEIQKRRQSWWVCVAKPRTVETACGKFRSGNSLTHKVSENCSGVILSKVVGQGLNVAQGVRVAQSDAHGRYIQT